MAKPWTLKAVSGPESGKTFTLKEGKTVLGRKNGDIVLRNDSEISSTHAEIIWDPTTGTATLVDLGSRNGTRLNGIAIEEPKHLYSGDQIRIGATELVVEAQEQQQEEGRVILDLPLAAATPAPEYKSSANRNPVSDPSPKSEAIKRTPKKTSELLGIGVATAAIGQLESDSKKIEKNSLKGMDGFFYEFYGTFRHITVNPQEFFESVAEEESLKPALSFAAANILLASVLPVLIGGPNSQGRIATMVLGFTIGPLAIPLIALLICFILALGAAFMHMLGTVLQGRAEFDQAVKAVCYGTAFVTISSICNLIQGYGAYLGLLCMLYNLYVLAQGLSVLYGVRRQLALGLCGLFALLTVTTHVLSKIEISALLNSGGSGEVQIPREPAAEVAPQQNEAPTQQTEAPTSQDQAPLQQ